MQVQECWIKTCSFFCMMRSWFKRETVKRSLEGQRLALKTSLVWKGSQTSFSMFPPARKMMVTSPISTQEKMKLIPTPLWRTDPELQLNLD